MVDMLREGILTACGVLDIGIELVDTWYVVNEVVNLKDKTRREKMPSQDHVLGMQCSKRGCCCWLSFIAYGTFEDLSITITDINPKYETMSQTERGWYYIESPFIVIIRPIIVVSGIMISPSKQGLGFVLGLTLLHSHHQVVKTITGFVAIVICPTINFVYMYLDPSIPCIKAISISLGNRMY